MLRIIEEAVEGKGSDDAMSLDELTRQGAREMLVKALEIEVAAYLEPLSSAIRWDARRSAVYDDKESRCRGSRRVDRGPELLRGVEG